MERYNGVSIIPQEMWSEPDKVISTDSCLSGCGGYSYWTSEYFHTGFPEFILKQGLDINCLELLTVVVALKLWGPFLKGKRFKVLCDNQTSVYVLNSGRCRNYFLSACLREIAYLCAVNETQLIALHIEGSQNRLSDLLSRSHYDPSLLQQFLKSVDSDMSERPVSVELFQFTSDW